MRTIKDVVEEVKAQMERSGLTEMEVTVHLDNYGKLINWDVFMESRFITPIKVVFTVNL